MKYNNFALSSLFYFFSSFVLLSFSFILMSDIFFSKIGSWNYLFYKRLSSIISILILLSFWLTSESKFVLISIFSLINFNIPYLNKSVPYEIFVGARFLILDFMPDFNMSNSLFSPVLFLLPVLFSHSFSS